MSLSFRVQDGWIVGAIEVRTVLTAGRAIVRRFAEADGLRDPDAFAHSWHILMKGSIVAAAEGDAEAARRAKSMARLLIEQHR
jgi:hypothetical protein